MVFELLFDEKSFHFYEVMLSIDDDLLKLMKEDVIVYNDHIDLKLLW
jgi:hypothetical protein